MMAKKGNLGFS